MAFQARINHFYLSNIVGKLRGTRIFIRKIRKMGIARSKENWTDAKETARISEENARKISIDQTSTLLNQIERASRSGVFKIAGIPASRCNPYTVHAIKGKGYTVKQSYEGEFITVSW